MSGTAAASPTRDEMVRIDGGEFVMGSDDHYAEEKPAHLARVDPFAIDAYAVTNRCFAEFVADTGYVTLAERCPDPANYPDADPATLVPGGLVFHATEGPVPLDDFRLWWRFVPGACWRHPEGPHSSIATRADHPVVQVAYVDALAYARWAGKSLPTEAQWEYAARGGLDGAEYAWGAEFMPDGRLMANTWHGQFPWENLAPTGSIGTVPVGSFPPNDYGLYDMCGNVWEWTRDRFTASHHPASCCGPSMGRAPKDRETMGSPRPQRAAMVSQRTVKGGSWLCAPSYCRRYRPAARQPQAADTATNHLGFRCVSLAR